ncbi:MAG: hypothetical protein LBG66_02535 [Gallionellaceae bacterium]|jgi:hypothetical protein|nr:hypothetical protein [Gallionellaceae bacterium]
MKHDQLIQKAALLLDMKDDAAGAEAVLREAITAVQSAGDTVHLMEAQTFLGELLFALGRQKESFDLLENVLQLAGRHDGEQDLVDSYTRAAKDILGQRQST